MTSAARPYRWLHRRPWVRWGSPLWTFLLLFDALDWLTFQIARLMGWRPNV